MMPLVPPGISVMLLADTLYVSLIDVRIPPSSTLVIVLALPKAPVLSYSFSEYSTVMAVS